MDINEQTFPTLLKDLLSRLYDRIAVEAHPLTPFFPGVAESPARAVEEVRSLIRQEIEALRPDGEEALLSIEWRPYWILRRRYVDGWDLRSIASALYIGDRQLRRDHSRALQVLSARLWQKYFKDRVTTTAPQVAEAPDESETIDLHPENLDLNALLRGMETLIRRRLQLENIQVDFILASAGIPVLTDRVFLRQVVLGLLNYVVHLHRPSQMTITTEHTPVASLRVSFWTDEAWRTYSEEEEDWLGLIRHWCKQLSIHLSVVYPPSGQSGLAELRLSFPHRLSRLVLIVDDQPAAQKMYRRYLSQTGLDVVGATSAAQALEIAREMQPALIILDIMMPHMDGWEVLQTLQLDAQTKNIPVLVCSAWGDADLARALGAADFLRKPVFQKDLLAALARLELLPEKQEKQ